MKQPPQVTWYTQEQILPVIPFPSPPLCPSLMLHTVREINSRRVLKRGGGGGQRGEQARGGGSLWSEPRLRPTTYLRRSVEDIIKAIRVPLTCSVSVSAEKIKQRGSHSGRGKESVKKGRNCFLQQEFEMTMLS